MQRSWRHHRFNGSSSPVLTATSFFAMRKPKIWPPQNQKPWQDWDKIWHGWLHRRGDPSCKISCISDRKEFPAKTGEIYAQFLLPPPRRLCFCQFLLVCLCVSKITQKVMDGSFWNFEGMSGVAQTTSDSILGVIRKESWILDHEDGDATWRIALPWWRYLRATTAF